MGNTLQTYWNKGKMKKIFLFPPRPPPQNLKEKNKTPRVQAEPSHWLHETSIHKTFWHRFQP
jgi:hypothetical protein